MSVLMEDRADLLRRRIELARRDVREGVDLPVAAAPLQVFPAGITGGFPDEVHERRRFHLSPSQIHPRLDHPMIGGDGYWIMYEPVFSERMPKAKAGGPARQGSHHGRDHAP